MFIYKCFIFRLGFNYYTCLLKTKLKFVKVLKYFFYRKRVTPENNLCESILFFTCSIALFPLSV